MNNKKQKLIMLSNQGSILRWINALEQGMPISEFVYWHVGYNRNGG